MACRLAVQPRRWRRREENEGTVFLARKPGPFRVLRVPNVGVRVTVSRRPVETAATQSSGDAIDSLSGLQI